MVCKGTGVVLRYADYGIFLSMKKFCIVVGNFAWITKGYIGCDWELSVESMSLSVYAYF